MHPFLRSIVAIVSGLIVAFLVVTGAEGVNSQLFPIQAGVDMSDTTAMKQYVASLPVSGFILVLAGWGGGALLGGWAAARVVRRSPMAHAMIVAGLLLCGGVANMLMLPHPAWVWVVGLSLFLLGGYAGGRLAQRGLGAVGKESQFV
ncbi:MAG: hypothetical protein ACM36C_05120 [Acidobacteriota bacterium]